MLKASPTSIPADCHCCQHIVYGMVCDEAEVFAARLDAAGLGLEFFAVDMEIQLLVAEEQGISSWVYDQPSSWLTSSIA